MLIYSSRKTLGRKSRLSCNRQDRFFFSGGIGRTDEIASCRAISSAPPRKVHPGKGYLSRCIGSISHSRLLDVNGRKYSALGFKNDKGGFELRNPDFQGCYPPKAITTFDHNTTTCNLFEGFTDFLSYLTLYPMKEKSLSPESAVVLNSTGNLEKALPFLSKHTQIYAYLDNDEPGKSAMQKLKKSGLPVTDCSNLYATDNDLNDFLQRMVKQKSTKNIAKSRRMKL